MPMTILSPFSLDPHSGKLTISELETTFVPNLDVAEVERMRISSNMTRVEIPSHEVGYQLQPTTLSNGTWLYITAGFHGRSLRLLGFGWGLLHDKWGFCEQTGPEFQEQLPSYVEWLEEELGPSLPISGRQAHRNVRKWGGVLASSDQRTNLPGIHLSFQPHNLREGLLSTASREG